MLPRRTIRLRLTLFYSTLFVASGAALLAIIYLLLRFASPAVLAHSSGSAPRISGQGRRLAPLPSLASMKAADDRQRADDQHQLLVVSAIALLGMALVSVLAGWLVAGRALRPLRAITAAARDLSSTDLHRRLALTGPDDELKELGDTFDGLIARLETSFRSQRQFVANASHELRTPLTLERALLEAALTDPEESLRATCERLLDLNAQQDRLIESLLTLASSERGLERWEDVDLAALAGSAVQARLAQAQRLGLRVESSLAPAVVAGEPELCARLIANLLDNALRYNIAGGVVSVATDGGWLVVRNTGNPVPADEVAELFEPFRRLGGRRLSGRRLGGSHLGGRHLGGPLYDANGHGLGLSIVSAIAGAHGATVSATARTSGGLDIEVRFPARNLAATTESK